MYKYVFIFFMALTMASAAFAAPPIDDPMTTELSPSEGLPQLDLSTFPSQIFWLGLTFTILYMAFSNKIVPAISANLENRTQTIQSNLDTAERLSEESEAFQKSYEDGLKNARQKSSALFSSMEAEMKADHDQRIALFQKKTETEIQATDQRLDQAVTGALSELETHIAETAKLAAQKIAGVEITDNAVQEAIKNSSMKKAKAV